MYTNIKTFEDACAALNLDAANVLPDYSRCPEKYRASEEADFKLKIIAEALNEGWQPNWQDPNEWKYTPWFDFNDKNAPLRFSYDGYYNWAQYSHVGSRLCFKNWDIAKYAGTQFIDLYRQAYVIQ